MGVFLAFVFVYCFYCLVRVMDMSLEDTLAALDLDDEASASLRTCRDGVGNFFPIPSGWSRSHTEDSTLTPGHTPLAPGTLGSY